MFFTANIFPAWINRLCVQLSQYMDITQPMHSCTPNLVPMVRLTENLATVQHNLE